MRINGLWIYHYLSVGYRRQKVIRMTQRILSLANRKTLGRLLRRSLQKIYQPLKSMLSWNHRAVLHSALSVRISLKSNSDPSWVSSHVHQAGLPHHMESEGSSTMGEQTCVMLNSSLTCEPTEPKRKTDRKQERWLQVQIKYMKCWYTGKRQRREAEGGAADGEGGNAVTPASAWGVKLPCSDLGNSERCPASSSASRALLWMDVHSPLPQIFGQRVPKLLLPLSFCQFPSVLLPSLSFSWKLSTLTGSFQTMLHTRNLWEIQTPRSTSKILDWNLQEGKASSQAWEPCLPSPLWFLNKHQVQLQLEHGLVSFLSIPLGPLRWSKICWAFPIFF